MSASIIFVFALLIPAQSFSACVDGVNNVVRLGNGSNATTIQVQNGTIRFYDEDGNPSCYNGSANWVNVGILKLSATFNVTKSLGLLTNMRVLLSATKNSPRIGVLCEDGISKHENTFKKGMWFVCSTFISTTIRTSAFTGCVRMATTTVIIPLSTLLA